MADLVANLPGHLIRSDRASTTHQRNLALKWVGNLVSERTERTPIYIHFIDDDVVVSPDYARRLENCLDKHQAVGATGRQINAPGRIRAPFWRRLLLLASATEGKLLASGVNVGIGSECGSSRRVDWLPGCSMSYRLDALDGLWFDDAKDGYVLGEDVVYSAEAALRGPLVYCARADYLHLCSPSGRLTDVDLIEQRIRYRLELADRIPRVNRPAVIISLAAEGGLLLLHGASHGSADVAQAGWTTLIRLSRLAIPGCRNL